MAFTDNCDIFLDVHEAALNRVVASSLSRFSIEVMACAISDAFW